MRRGTVSGIVTAIRYWPNFTLEAPEVKSAQSPSHSQSGESQVWCDFKKMCSNSCPM